ncbi:hypothetical protein TRICI_005496 [Trichomonascus ciferrii]|uniref:Major facilitator superfamily (MFS) profile domain-containing protein n=1 Tax=Trichomonascus ciferrii TaxID=44093 RepID=A0A642UX20_9ASCO|nr:hypothetical protein TRICI_005496 [Trichomonascus ciferrii]
MTVQDANNNHNNNDVVVDKQTFTASDSARHESIDSSEHGAPVPLQHSTFPPVPALPMIEPSVSNVSRLPDAAGDAETNSNITNADFPEGGARAWTVVFGAWCGLACTFGLVNSLGFIQAWLSENDLRDHPESQVSWIASVYMFLFYCGGVQSGPLFDTYGLKVVMIPGCIGTVVSVFILSVCKEYYQFMLGFGVLGGLSASMVFTPSIAVVGHWFYVRRGIATGVASTGGALFGVIYPLAMNRMAHEIGFPWTVRVVGFIELALCLGAILTLRTRLKNNDKQSGLIDLSAFKDLQFSLTAIGTFMIEWGLFIPLNYITTYSIASGVNVALAYQMLAILNAASVPGRALPGYFADKWGRFNVMIVTILVCGVLCVALWIPAKTNLGAIIAFAVLFGLFSGTGISLTPVCISQICRTEDYGKRYGTCFFFVSFAVLTGLPIAGEIMNSQQGHYEGLIGFAAATYFVGAAFFIAARIIGGGTSWKAIY